MRRTLDVRQMTQRLADAYGMPAATDLQAAPSAAESTAGSGLQVYVDYEKDLFRFR